MTSAPRPARRRARRAPGPTSDAEPATATAPAPAPAPDAQVPRPTAPRRRRRPTAAQLTSLELVRTRRARHLGGDEEVAVLQLSPCSPRHTVARVASALVSALQRGGRPAGDATWRFFLATGRPHDDGLTTWLGVGGDPPPGLLDDAERLFVAMAHRVARARAAVAASRLQPFLVVTADALEVPRAGPHVVDLVDLAPLAPARVVVRPLYVDGDLARRDDPMWALVGHDDRLRELLYDPDD